MKILFLFLLCVSLFAETLTIDSGSPADQFFTGGLSDFTISYPGATGDLSVRYGAFSYHIPRPPGVYLVTLNFRETGTVSAKNQRVFSVKVGGQLVLDRLDLFFVAGLAKIERNFVAASNDGFIDIDFSYVTKSAIISSITVQTLFAGGSIGAPVVTDWWTCQSGIRPFVAGASTPPGWSCDGLQSYTFTLQDGTVDGPYVAVKMQPGFVLDPVIWVKQ